MKSLSELFEYKYKPLDEMTKEELEEELDVYRKMWTWVEEPVKAWLTHIHYPVKFVRRDYKILDGVMGQPHFEIKAIDIDVEEEIFNYSLGTITTETKTITLGIGQIIDYEFIHEKEVVRMQKPEEVATAKPELDVVLQD